MKQLQERGTRDGNQTYLFRQGVQIVNAVIKPVITEASNDGYWLTPEKAQDKRRIARVKANNVANSRVFDVDGECMTVKQIAILTGFSSGKVSKDIRRMRTHGRRRFTIDDFKRKAANDDQMLGQEEPR